MIPVYLAEMEIVKETDPEIYQEFQNGNCGEEQREGSILCRWRRLA